MAKPAFSPSGLRSMQLDSRSLRLDRCCASRTDCVRGFPHRRSKSEANLRGELEGTQASGVIIDMAREDQLIGLVRVDESLETASDGSRITHKRTRQRLADGGFLRRRKVSVDVVGGWRKLTGRAAAKVRKALLYRREEAA